MHCSDENLVAYLDGELAWWKRRPTARHLQSCWQCRTRLAAAEQQIQQLTREIGEWPFPPPGWKPEGKLRLNSGIRKLEAEAAARQTIHSRQWRKRHWIWQSALCAALAVAMVALWPQQSQKQSPVTASAAIARASAVEHELYSKPLQQTFAVEIAELRPARRTRSTRLEVWADRGTGRFASRWIGEDGALKHALWRAGRGHSDVLYDPAVSREPVRWKPASDQQLPLSSLAEYGLDLAQVESAFLKWLESGMGRAVSFTPDLAVWSHQDGTTLRAEPVRVNGEAAAVRVTAQRTDKRITAVLRIEYDPDSYLPRLQALRFETPERVVEFRLSATRITPVLALDGDLFSPAKELFNERVLSSFPVLPQQPDSSPNVLRAVGGALVDGVYEALEAHFVLHQAGACLGEPVKIEERSDGVRIQSLSQGAWRESFTARARLSAVLAAFGDLRDAAPPVSDLPESADAALTSGASLRHAWALTRLGIHFPARRTANMTLESWRLLEIMVRDHVTFIDADLEAYHLPAVGVRPAEGRDWRRSSSTVLEALRRALALSTDEPMAKLVPLLQEVDAELHVMSDAFSSEHQSSGAVVASHGR